MILHGFTVQGVHQREFQEMIRGGGLLGANCHGCRTSNTAAELYVRGLANDVWLSLDFVEVEEAT